MQIAVCAAIHQVSIEVHTDFGKQSFGAGQLWGLRHTSHPAGHYDVVTRESQAPSTKIKEAKPRNPTQEATQDNKPCRTQAEEPKAKPDSHRPTQWKQATSRLGGKKKSHVVRSVNVNGCREAMLNAFCRSCEYSPHPGTPASRLGPARHAGDSPQSWLARNLGCSQEDTPQGTQRRHSCAYPPTWAYLPRTQGTQGHDGYHSVDPPHCHALRGGLWSPQCAPGQGS